MRNIQDLKDTLDHSMIRSINKMISAKFEIPLSKYGIEVHDFISNLYVLAYKRGTYDKTKAKVSTYFYWLARTEMSHIKDSKKIKWAYGKPIFDENGFEQIFIEDTTVAVNPQKSLELNEERDEKRQKLADHFCCSLKSIQTLLEAEPKEVMPVAKTITITEGFDVDKAKAFMAKIKTARSLGGFARSK